MPDFVQTITVGQAKVSIINIGDIYLPLAKYMNVPPTDLAKRVDLAELAHQTVIPIHSILVQLPNLSLLVDAGAYDVVTDPDCAISGYVPPAGLAHQLTELGVDPEQIAHVIITHRHWDHFNGTTVERAGEYVPQFPNAQHYLGRADWERVEQAFQDSASVEYRTLRVLNNRGMLKLIDGNYDLGHGVEILAAPGETAGHQIVRLHSAGETLYVLGDLYHHPVEFAQPEWKVSWAKAETIIPSRYALAQRAVAENALLVATHIPAIGRLRLTNSGVVWETVK